MTALGVLLTGIALLLTQINAAFRQILPASTATRENVKQKEVHKDVVPHMFLASVLVLQISDVVSIKSHLHRLMLLEVAQLQALSPQSTGHLYQDILTIMHVSMMKPPTRWATIPALLRDQTTHSIMPSVT